ncbi:M14 family zinc carboxypeptidase [Nakamurella sp.]|uniref:M14 family zinc carboxypeptidase n=1 Tax=Nakamurella sp. TaxID=1869182 RepID=UPI003B3A07E8
MYRTVDQLDRVVERLVATAPEVCTRLPLPETSRQGRAIAALRLAAPDGPPVDERPGVLLIAGTHARELMNPDLLVELAVDLIAAHRTGADLVLGARTWTGGELRALLGAVSIHLLPCVNPDGRTYVLTVDDMWRKNRRDNPGTACDGVDLNRNADILWGVTEGQTSCTPCTDIYCGPAAFSEPENRNVRHLLDTARIDHFVDVHSFSELVIYPWGHAPNQTTDPAQNFRTLPTGTCRPLGRPGYAEYIAPDDLAEFRRVAGRIVDEIAAVRGRRYSPEPGMTLYPTTGTHSDYAWSRHLSDPALARTYGYTIETGPAGDDAREAFHPRDPEPIKREVESGLLGLLQVAAGGAGADAPSTVTG